MHARTRTHYDACVLCVYCVCVLVAVHRLGSVGCREQAAQQHVRACVCVCVYWIYA